MRAVIYNLPLLLVEVAPGNNSPNLCTHLHMGLLMSRGCGEGIAASRGKERGASEMGPCRHAFGATDNCAPAAASAA